MDLKAENVLSDCHIANEKFNDLHDAEWRIQFTLLVTLLRMVGHVLHKVDCKNNNKLAQIVERKFKEWKDESKNEHQIFREFIEKERNIILKEYQINYRQSVTVFIGENLTAQYNHQIKDGVYAGYEPKTLVNEALEWWKNEINSIKEESKTV